MLAGRVVTHGCQPSNLGRGNKRRRLGVQTGPLGHCGKGVPAITRYGTWSLTQGSQPCASVHCEVQTGSGIGSLQIHRPCQRRQGGSHSGCHLLPGEHRREQCMCTGISLLTMACPDFTPANFSIPAHREGSVVQGHGNPHSGLSRRTFSAAATSHALPLPVPSVSAHGLASSLEHRA